MYNHAFFMPNYMSSMAAPSMMRGMGAMRGLGAASGPMMRGAANAAGRGLGLFGRLGSGLSAFRSINWSNLINGASKTLGVVNQAIPLVRQVGPMMNNMRSMLKVASLFKDETDKDSKRKNTAPISNQGSNRSYMNNTSSASSNIERKNTDNERSSNTIYSKENESDDNDHSPTFFIPA